MYPAPRIRPVALQGARLRQAFSSHTGAKPHNITSLLRTDTSYWRAPPPTRSPTPIEPTRAIDIEQQQRRENCSRFMVSGDATGHTQRNYLDGGGVIRPWINRVFHDLELEDRQARVFLGMHLCPAGAGGRAGEGASIAQGWLALVLPRSSFLVPGRTRREHRLLQDHARSRRLHVCHFRGGVGPGVGARTGFGVGICTRVCLYAPGSAMLARLLFPAPAPAQNDIAHAPATPLLLLLLPTTGTHSHPTGTRVPKRRRQPGNRANRGKMCLCYKHARLGSLRLRHPQVIPRPPHGSRKG
ncbi:hypothetical protein BC826DRAFT_973471 [Russula brevipes]|nr:hypothetical protein BC826DRAFT_973471 [Russula brevipes]